MLARQGLFWRGHHSRILCSHVALAYFSRLCYASCTEIACRSDRGSASPSKLEKQTVFAGAARVDLELASQMSCLPSRMCSQPKAGLELGLNVLADVHTIDQWFPGLRLGSQDWPDHGNWNTSP